MVDRRSGNCAIFTRNLHDAYWTQAVPRTAFRRVSVYLHPVDLLQLNMGCPSFAGHPAEGCACVLVCCPGGLIPRIACFIILSSGCPSGRLGSGQDCLSPGTTAGTIPYLLFWAQGCPCVWKRAETNTNIQGGKLVERVQSYAENSGNRRRYLSRRILGSGAGTRYVQKTARRAG